MYSLWLFYFVGVRQPPSTQLFSPTENQSILAQKNNIEICPDLIEGTYIVWVYNGFIVWFCNAQVITITSEKETDGFFAPSITIMAMDAEGWRGNLPFEKCQKSQN